MGPSALCGGPRVAEHGSVVGTTGWSAVRERDRSGSPAANDSAVAPDTRSGSDMGVSSADLVAGYRPRIYRYILSMVHDPVEADDLTQEAFLQAHRKLGSLRDPDALTSWLYRIATHVCYDRFRKWSRQPILEPLDANGSTAASPAGGGTDAARLDRLIERSEMSACVSGFLEELSDEYRQVILLHDLEGLTNPEIAEMLGASVDAVKIRLHRARRKLHVALAASCDFSHDEQGVFVCEPAAASPTAT